MKTLCGDCRLRITLSMETPTCRLKWRLLWIFSYSCIVFCQSETNEVNYPRGHDPRWGSWSNWTECSRTCGLGISSRTRACQHQSVPDSSANLTCVGSFKEYTTCNAQRCPTGSLEFRAFQCQRHNNRPYNQIEYSWEPFYKGLNRCALLCRPKGSRFYLQVSTVVADGTRCDPNDPYHVCIDGKCESIGCDGVIGSQQRFDKCGICGGRDSTCHIISGIFTQTVLPPGYNRVTSIPKGACNINITELAPSLNRLALRIANSSYVINGNWALMNSDDYEGAGTVFTYYHPSPTEILESVVEYITAPGPVNFTIDVMVIHEHLNRGIMYTYTIPSQKGQSSPNHRHHFRHHGRRHFMSSTLPTSLLSTAPASLHSDGKEVQSDQVHGGGSSRSQNHTSVLDNRHRQKPALPRLYHAPGGGGYQYPLGNVPANRFISTSNQSAAGPDAYQADSAFRPSIYRGPQVPGTVDQSEGDGKLDRRGNPGVARQPGFNYRGPARRPLQPGINHRIQGPPILQSPHGQAQPPYIIPGQSGLGYGQPQPGIYSPGVYGQPAWYPRHHHQPGGYQSPPYVPYPSYHQQGPYPIHEPAPSVQQPYYPVRSLSLEQPPRDASVYNPYDYYQGRYPSPLNDQRAVVPPLGPSSSLTLTGVGDFAWKVSGFGECSQTCGGGVQETLIVCMKITGAQVIVTEENCDAAVKPTGRSVTCNTMACPPGWEASNWSECSTTCDRGQQTRIVECKQRMSATYAVSVSATHCLQAPRPETSRVCNEDRPCVRWMIGDWSQCSTECGRGQRTREVVCVNFDDKPIPENKCNGTKPKATDYCDMGSCAKTWFYTEWTEQCSTGCGDGVHTRHIHCSAEPARCGEINRPKSEKPCKNEFPCGGKWFMGPWSDCTASCGEGVIKRDVVCMKKLGKAMAIVSDENCEESEKPESEEACELEACQSEWYMTDWVECSRSCDTGLRLREVKCLDENQEPSQSCDPLEKPETRQSCNTQKCPSRAELSDNAQPLVISCQDKFKNCRVVVQARLCRYPYYKDVCCFSCISHDHDEET